MPWCICTDFVLACKLDLLMFKPQYPIHYPQAVVHQILVHKRDASMCLATGDFWKNDTSVRYKTAAIIMQLYTIAYRRSNVIVALIAPNTKVRERECYRVTGFCGMQFGAVILIPDVMLAYYSRISRTNSMQKIIPWAIHTATRQA
jgi:hypothetical protein